MADGHARTVREAESEIAQLESEQGALSQKIRIMAQALDGQKAIIERARQMEVEHARQSWEREKAVLKKEIEDTARSLAEVAHDEQVLHANLKAQKRMRDELERKRDDAEQSKLLFRHDELRSSIEGLDEQLERLRSEQRSLRSVHGSQAEGIRTASEEYYNGKIAESTRELHAGRDAARDAARAQKEAEAALETERTRSRTLQEEHMALKAELKQLDARNKARRTKEEALNEVKRKLKALEKSTVARRADHEFKMRSTVAQRDMHIKDTADIRDKLKDLDGQMQYLIRKRIRIKEAYQLYIDGIEHRRRVERIERDSARDAGSSSGSESGSYTSEGDESSATGSRRK